jgi:carbamate kinase
LLVLTDVTNAYIDYRGPNERPLGEVTVAELERYVHQGHFTAGSMGPKVEAALRLARVGRTGIITSLTTIRESIEGTAGTRVVRERAPAPPVGLEPPMAEATTLLTSTIGE